MLNWIAVEAKAVILINKIFFLLVLIQWTWPRHSPESAPWVWTCQWSSSGRWGWTASVWQSDHWGRGSGRGWCGGAGSRGHSSCQGCTQHNMSSDIPRTHQTPGIKQTSSQKQYLYSYEGKCTDQHLCTCLQRFEFKFITCKYYLVDAKQQYESCDYFHFNVPVKPKP